jgi:predicted AlkP superfamily phosphohydrolase/phosphomutase/Flp pilus assembly protein TadD
MTKRLAKKLLLVGWDGADWQIIQPLLDRGLMPALESLISRGVMGNLASHEPMLSPMLWTTMATGKPPAQHGICGFAEPDPSSEHGARLVTSTSRKCKAFWNILSQEGFKTHLIGWIPSHPAEPINGICTTELFARAVDVVDQPWPIIPGSVHPPELSATLDELRVHPEDIVLEQLASFVPRASEIDQTSDPHLQRLAVRVAEAATQQAVATWILETQPWDTMAIYFNMIDYVCHSFMYYHPPRMAHIPEERYELFKEVVNMTYQFQDLLLNRLLKLAGEEATVMVVSDHGYHTGERRPQLTPAEPTGPVVWHRPVGIFAMAGPHVRQDELVFGARVIDITPTLLTVLGVPVGDDMLGQPLVQAFEGEITPERIESWENVPGQGGPQPAAAPLDPAAEQAASRQLIELGYLEPMAASRAEGLRKVTDDQRYNLARSFMSAGNYRAAQEPLEQVHESQPTRLAVALNLADCYQRLGENQKCRQLIDRIAAGECFDPGMEDASLKVVPQLDLLYGLLELNEGQTDKALAHLLKAEEADAQLRGLHTQIGNVYLRMNNFEAAERAFTRALEQDEDDPVAHQGMAVVHLSADRNDLAMESALHSVETHYHQPRSHFYLALALARLGHLPRARGAIAVCLQMDPKNEQARQLQKALAPVA